MRLLSLDASTSTIGLAVFDYTNFSDKKLIHYEYFKPPKNGDIFERLAKVRDFIYTKLDKYSPDEVALEDIILFMKNKSSAATISSLAVLNRTVGLTIYNNCGKSPTLLNVMKIRHAIKTDKKLPSKEEIPNLVATHLLMEFPWIFNKKGKVIEENYDMADAIAVGLAFIKIKDIELAPKKESKKKKKKIL
jgi:Holliday junction resolvasome RuvABC endonuclease subunit